MNRADIWAVSVPKEQKCELAGCLCAEVVGGSVGVDEDEGGSSDRFGERNAAEFRWVNGLGAVTCGDHDRSEAEQETRT